MEVSAKSTTLSDIPIEIIRSILLKLQVKSMVRSQWVCKEWSSIIQDPDFKHSYRGHSGVVVASQEPGTRTLHVTSITNNLRHEKYFQINLSPLKTSGGGGGVIRPLVWCSCNGLVLFSVEEHILLCNPYTRCSTKVLELRILKDLDSGQVVSGLCYDSSARDYKAVLSIRHKSAGRFVIVTGLRNKEWRQVPFPYSLRSIRDGVDFHNTFHWRVSDIEDDDSECNKIVYFDPECDEFRELPTPKPRDMSSERPLNSKNSILGLGIIDNCLCMVRKETEKIEVMMMKKYNVKESWVHKLFELDDHNKVLYFPENDLKVLIWNPSRGDLRIFLRSGNRGRNLLKGLACSGEHVGTCSYVESVASPHRFIWRYDQHKWCADKIKWIRKMTN